MDVVSIRHMARLTEWRQRILACRTSGMPVTAWCAENHISSKTYYRWERLCLAKVSWDENATAQVGGVARSSESEPAGQLVKIDPHQFRDAAEQWKNLQMQDRITLRYGNLSVEMPCGTPVEQLAALMKALVGRKGWLFCDTPEGAKATAVLYTILETAKVNHLNPETYLRHLLTTLQQRQASKPECPIDDLLPWSDAMQKQFKTAEY